MIAFCKALSWQVGLATLLAVYKCFKTTRVSVATVCSTACWGKRTANIWFPETLICDVPTVQVPWESLGFQESFPNVVVHILCFTMFTSNSLLLLFTAFCWHHHFSELPQHQQFHHVTGLQPRWAQEPAPAAKQSPTKKPSPPHADKKLQRTSVDIRIQLRDPTSPCPCITSQTVNCISPKTSNFHHMQEEDWRKGFLPLVATVIIKDTFKWDKVLSSAERQHCFSLLTWNIQNRLCTTPSGKKKMKANHNYYN